MAKIDTQPESDDNIDWSLTHWDGAKREAMRRWAKLPLAQIIASLEEMENLSNALTQGSNQVNTASASTPPVKADTPIDK